VARILQRLHPPPRWIIAGIVALFAALAVIAFFFLPQWMVNDGDFKLAGLRLKAENDIRTIGLQYLGGAVLALGALFTGINLIYNRESQITERFTRAVDQLGHGERDVRIGGIYALERIGRDSSRDHRPVMAILATYVKERAPWPGGKEIGRRSDANIEATRSRRPKADVQAALTVLGRRNTSHERKPLFFDFSETNLCGADFSGGNFASSSFAGALLEWANLSNSILRDASLEFAHCHGAVFRSADLSGASLRRADLQDATWDDADLSDAKKLEEADLRGGIYSDGTTLPAFSFAATMVHRDELEARARVKALNAREVELDNERREMEGSLDEPDRVGDGD
jgi:hypothetical protein